jgi:hypothetical protein
MAVVSYNQWLPIIQVDVPDCPKALIIEAIRQKVIEFCSKTRFLRKELDGFYTVDSDSEYELETPVDTTIVDVLTVKVNKRELTPKTQDDLENLYQDWRDQSGEPRYFFLKDTKTAVFVPIPNDIYPVRVLVVLKPTQSAQDVDEVIFEEYRDIIKHGALSYLMQMYGKAWSEPNMAVFHENKYQAGVSEALLRSQRSYALRKTFRVKPNYF